MNRSCFAIIRHIDRNLYPSALVGMYVRRPLHQTVALFFVGPNSRSATKGLCDSLSRLHHEMEEERHE